MIGRRAELDAIDDLLAGAQAGSPGVLRLVGAPGIGKTARLDAAAARAEHEGMRVVRLLALELEAGLPAAALGVLLPLLGHDPKASSAALLAALSHAASEGPLLLLRPRPCSTRRSCAVRPRCRPRSPSGRQSGAVPRSRTGRSRRSGPIVGAGTRAPGATVEVFQTARTELLLGKHLRRSRQPREARAPLRRAVEVFDRLDARTWAERARRELEAAGERPTTAAEPVPLTPQELRVAEAVGDGLSNAEVAAALFLSVKTVEFHLSRVYRKLGLRSRGGLARALRQHAPAVSHAEGLHQRGRAPRRPPGSTGRPEPRTGVS